jgi:hypothetical protein
MRDGGRLEVGRSGGSGSGRGKWSAEVGLLAGMWVCRAIESISWQGEVAGTDLHQ